MSAPTDPADLAKLLNREGPHAKTYTATETKHFSNDTPGGSVFTDPEVKTLEDLLNLAKAQREEGLAGDDRDKIISLGADPEAFLPQCRYLLVQTPGLVGIIADDQVPDKTLVHVEQTKPTDTHGSLIIEVKSMPKTDIGIIILGPDPDTGEEILWTAHPGLPVAPVKETDPNYRHLMGQALPLSHLKATQPGRRILLLTRLAKPKTKDRRRSGKTRSA